MTTDPRAHERAQRIEALFHELHDLAPAAREAPLAECAAREPEVAARVRALLAAAESSESYFAGLAGRIAAARDAEGAPELHGRRVGPWVLESLLGRGGMGAVYRASRADQQFEKAVAVKLVPVGLLSETARERFRRERQTLARLEHPNIARLLDGGVLEDTTPYLVMELVEGLPIDRWCDDRSLGVSERVRRLLPVLDAVQYAHQSLVLHSDIKPANVLVSERGEPKLIDFGIARSLAADTDTASTLTRRATPLTPAYASPEQLRGEPLTTASDVHALGALLYTVLAGRPPFELDGRSTAEVERLVGETMPRAPSAVAPPERAAALRGDLDTIVLRALQKEPARRYASAGALADDLRAHLDGRPIAARRDRAAYVLSRFVRRHRAVVALSLGALTLLVGFAVTIAALNARHAREVAAERDAARRQARTAEAVAGFLASLYDGADPDVAAGRELTAHELLDQSALRLDADLAGQPEVHARMATIMASLYDKLGRPEDGLALARRAVELRAELPGGDPLARAADLELLARLCRELDRYPASDSALALADSLRRGAAVDSSDLAPGSLARALAAADRAQPAAAESLLALAERGYRRSASPDTAALAEIAATRAYLALNWGDPAQAVPLLATAERLRSARFGASHSAVRRTQRERAEALIRLERYPEAERLLSGIRPAVETALGPEHNESLIVRELHAMALSNMDRVEEAAPLLESVLAARRRALGDPHVQTLRTANALGLLYREAGRDEDALAELRFAAEGFRRLGPAALTTRSIVDANIANVLITLQRWDEAESLLKRLRAEIDANPARTNDQLDISDFAFARVHSGRGEHARAEPVYRRVLANFRAWSGGADTPRVAGVEMHLGRLLLDTGRPEEAAAMLRHAAAVFGTRKGHDSLPAVRSRILLAAALARTGHAAESDTLLARALAVQRRRLAPGHVLRREGDAIERSVRARLAALER